MNEQLRLLAAESEPNPWVLDDHQREVGRRGVAEVRRALQEARSREAA